MKKWERAAAIFLTLIGIGAATQAREMGFGNFHHPGPGFFPFWLSFFLAIVSVIYLLTQSGKDFQPAPLWKKRTWVRPFLATVVLLIYANLLSWIGFFSATFFLFLVWLIIIEREKWLTVGLVSVLGTAGLYFIFTVFLKIPLPKGMLF